MLLLPLLILSLLFVSADVDVRRSVVGAAVVFRGCFWLRWNVRCSLQSIRRLRKISIQNEDRFQVGPKYECVWWAIFAIDLCLFLLYHRLFHLSMTASPPPPSTRRARLLFRILSERDKKHIIHSDNKLTKSQTLEN